MSDDHDPFLAYLLLGICFILTQCGPESVVDKTMAYKRGQVDCLLGNIKYATITNSDRIVHWEYINK